jgi:hypothetical protein
MEKVLLHGPLEGLPRKGRAIGQFAAKGARLSCAFHYLVKILGVSVNEFLPIITADGQFPGTPVSRKHLFEIFAGHRPFRRKTMLALADRINAFLAQALQTCEQLGTASELKISLRRFAFIRITPKSLQVMPHDLFLVYEGRLNPYVRPDATGSGEDVVIEIIVQSNSPKPGLSERERREWLMDLVRKGSFQFGKSESSLKITLALTPEQANDIILRYRNGELEKAGIVALRQLGMPESRLMRKIAIPTGDIAVESGDLDMRLRRAWKIARVVEALILPIRRLRWLFSPEIRCTPLANVFAEASTRYYSADLVAQGSKFAVDLAVCWIAWPVVTALGLWLVLMCFGLHLGVELLVAISSGVILAFIGAQVCSTVISPLACSAGAVVMGMGFGVAQGLILAHLGMPGSEAIRRDPFLSAVGGLIGLSATDWHTHFPPYLSSSLLVLVGVSIGLAGWLMAQPRKASLASAKRTGLRDLSIGIAGSLTGVLIGIVYGVSALLMRFGMLKVAAFGLAFALVGSSTFGVTIWLRLQRAKMLEKSGIDAGSALRRSIALGICHLLVSASLTLIAFTSTGRVSGLLGLVGLSAWFHATWFTAAHVVSDRYGSPNAAILATTLEGSLGFVVFVLFRMQ